MKKIFYEWIYKFQEYFFLLGEIYYCVFFGGYILVVDEVVFVMVLDGEFYFCVCEESVKYCVKNGFLFLILMKCGWLIFFNYYCVDDGFW